MIFFKRIFDQNASLFHVSYRQKVSKEFVAAALEREAGAALPAIWTQTPSSAVACSVPNTRDINKTDRDQRATKPNSRKIEIETYTALSDKRKRPPAKHTAKRSKREVVEESSSSSDDSEDEGFFGASGSAIGCREEDLMEAALEEMLDNEDCGQDDFDENEL